MCCLPSLGDKLKNIYLSGIMTICEAYDDDMEHSWKSIVMSRIDLNRLISSFILGNNDSAKAAVEQRLMQHCFK